MPCQLCLVFKASLYTLDIGTDAYSTYSFHNDCHYHLFAASLVLMFLPNLVCSIGFVVATLRF